MVNAVLCFHLFMSFMVILLLVLASYGLIICAFNFSLANNNLGFISSFFFQSCLHVFLCDIYMFECLSLC